MISTSDNVCLVKLDPGTEITEGLLEALRSLGWREAVILSATGSVRDAHLRHATPEGYADYVVPGRALEVGSIAGRLTQEDQGAEPILTAIVCDRHGASFGGRLVRGSNRVCVTVEATILRI